MRLLLRSVVATAVLAAAMAVVAGAEEGKGPPAAAAKSLAPGPSPPAPDQSVLPAASAEKAEGSATDGKAAAGKVPAVGPLPEDYSCTFCHADPQTFSGDTKHLLVSEKDLAGDIHWQKGLRCHDCHGGHAKLDEHVDHRDDSTYRGPRSPAEIPGLCGRCHSSIEYMRRYNPSPRTDQESEYWTSGHGLRLKGTPEDKDVATCSSCHGHHGIQAANELQSRVYPTRLAETCATCHADAAKMKGRTYHGKPLGHNQYDDWKESVHAQALLKQGDLSAPTCNDCHGNHGAVPPEVDSVANACGTCHVKVATLFAQTVMKHRFEQADWEGLPGCAACHGNHEIRQPSDAMLGMGREAFCSRCHGEGKGKYPDALAGKTAEGMSQQLEQLKQQVAAAEERLDDAEHLGMEVREPRFRLRTARDSLTNARSLVHGFAIAPMKQAVDEGLEVAASVEQDGQKQLEEYTYRRIWLAVSLVPILIAVCLLLVYIRSLPIPGR
jgi:predicted CXXCH cytochrome family protein